jgi:hypothetical protein
MRKQRRSFWVSAKTGLLAVALSGAAGCGAAAACDTSDGANPVVTYAGGDTQGTVYESSPWGSYLDYPGGSRYEFVHHLGRVPTDVLVYLAFGETSASASLCAGNSCVITRTDDVAVGVKNDTCSEFWVRIVARSSELASDAGAAE